jgi:uncharacterized membrane protein
MTTAQIIILITTILVFIISLYILTTNKNDNAKNNSMFFVYLSFGFMTLVAFLSTKTAMESSKEHKCPEYEKVENVYKLKE